jgi:rhamnose transport system substrate-binding protein
MCAAFAVSGCTRAETTYKVIYNSGSDETESQQSQPTGETTQKKTYKIAIVPKISGIPYFNVAEDGAREAGEHLGVEVVYAGPQVADAKHQIEVVERLIEQGMDAIAIAANDPQALAPVMQKAQKLGIKVMTWDSDTVQEARTIFVNQVDGETLGRHLMDLLASHVKERGEFAIMTGSLTAMNLNEWIKWIKVQQETYYPNMKLVDLVANDEDPQKAYTLALEMLDRHPDLKGIIGIASISPPASAKAVKDRGKDLIVVGVSSPGAMEPYINAGVAPVVTLWSPKKLGYLTVFLAKQLLDGQMPYDGQDIANVGKIRVHGDVIIMGEPLDFTKENAVEYDF